MRKYILSLLIFISSPAFCSYEHMVQFTKAYEKALQNDSAPKLTGNISLEDLSRYYLDISPLQCGQGIENVKQKIGEALQKQEFFQKFHRSLSNFCSETIFGVKPITNK